VFYNVVFGKMIKVDSSPIPAEKNAGDSQEISQRFREIVYALHCLDERAYCEVPAVAITGAGKLSLAGEIRTTTAYMYP